MYAGADSAPDMPTDRVRLKMLNWKNQKLPEGAEITPINKTTFIVKLPKGINLTKIPTPPEGIEIQVEAKT